MMPMELARIHFQIKMVMITFFTSVDKMIVMQAPCLSDTHIFHLLWSIQKLGNETEEVYHHYYY